jgi:hypothetical protein
MTTRDNSRLKRFPISGLHLLTLFRTGDEAHFKVESGFPADSIIVRHYYDRDYHQYFLFIQSETFDPVKEGDQIPWGTVIVSHAVPRKENEKEKGTDENKGAPETEAPTGEAQTDVSAGAQPGAAGPG